MIEMQNKLNNKPNKNKNISEKEKLRLWLKNVVHLEEYFNLFTKNGFDELDDMKDITINDLNIIGIKKLGHKKKLIKYIQKLNANNNKNNENNKNIQYNEGQTEYM